jgi:undecaprenyl-diphosphatase
MDMPKAGRGRLITRLNEYEPLTLILLACLAGGAFLLQRLTSD